MLTCHTMDGQMHSIGTPFHRSGPLLACIGIPLKLINNGRETVFNLTTGLQKCMQYIKQSNWMGLRCGKKRFLKTLRFVRKT